MPKRCIFDDDIECFAEGCFAECRHHPSKKAILKKPKEHEKMKKVFDILARIVTTPVFLIFLLLCWVFGLDTDFKQLSDKELFSYMLLVYGLAFVLVLLYMCMS